MKVAILILMLIFALPAYAKSKPLPQCHTFFKTSLIDSGEASDGYGVYLEFEIENKSKKTILAIDGAVFVQAKGDRGTSILTRTVSWEDGLAQGERGTFDLETSRTGMTLTAIASGKPINVASGMYYASILYDDGQIKKCSSQKTLLIPLIPYI